MKDKDYIKELFSEKLSSHEVPVRSDLWSGIQSQLGNTAATTTVAAKGISIAAKWAIGIASSVIVAGSVAWFASDGEAGQKTQVQLSSTAQETKITEVPADGTEVKETVAATVQPSGKNVQKSVDQRTHSNSINELQDTKAGVMDNPPLIVLPAAVKPAENNVQVVDTKPSDNKSVPSDNKVESKTNQEAAKTVAEQPKVVGEIEQWKKTNVFSPNGDGVNDTFSLKTKNLKEFQITIYNNLNKKTVFSSSDPNFVWYGEDVPSGSYGYVIIAVDENGNRIAMANELTILK